MTSAKTDKQSINKSSNKSDIIAANNELKQALEVAKAAKVNADSTNNSIKEQLKASISQANQLLPQLSDNDSEIAKAKKSLDAEVKNANQAVTSNNTASMQSAKSSLDTKINQINQQLQQFNKDKDAKFKELEQTRKDIDSFLTEDVKRNPNYTALVNTLTSAKTAKQSINKSSNKSDIIAANNELKQALEVAKAAKVNADSTNNSIKEQLKASISQANQLLPQLSDNDSEIAKAKKSLDAEVKNANQAVTSNNTASMQSAKSSLDTKINQINQQLQQFNKDKDAKFKELEQTRKDIDSFLTEDVKRNPNYTALVNTLTSAKTAKQSINKSSNRSDIIAANNELKQALEVAKAAKVNADSTNNSIKEQLKASISQANQLLPQLSDNDSEIVKAKKSLDAEVKNANQAVTSNNTASMQSAKSSLDTKINQINQQLQQFNKDKDAKFKELEQTRKDIDSFLTEDVKRNPNYTALVNTLTSAKTAKQSINKSSNKSDIIAANNELKQALEVAKAAKVNADSTNNSIKEQLKASISQANQLLPQLSDNDSEIAKAKKSLDAEVKNANQAVTSNNTASMQSAKSSLDTKINQINQQLQQFNKDKDAKFKELEQTRKDIDSFLTEDVKRNPNYTALVNTLTSAKTAKQSINKSSNRSDIIAANNELKQALEVAKAAKVNADSTNNSIKEQLKASISQANQLLPQLSDNDSEIVKAKKSLDAEVKNANQAVTSNNTASMQSAKSSLDTKINQINQQLQQFNKDKDAKFKELEQTRKDIDSFLTEDVKEIQITQH
ncbi:hypothetical protein [Metamycoplasma hominis]|uniref:hypothetical protein n=1 Tax=Metamycoplasma hominis TaxID=2098 RepID=UPI001F525550|nr:hypothetical protein [Metamycoplasma hominis]